MRQFQIQRSNEFSSEGVSRATTVLEDDSRFNDWGRSNPNERDVYLIDELRGSDNTVLNESFDNSVSDHHRYVNIEAMSEYI